MLNFCVILGKIYLYYQNPIRACTVLKFQNLCATQILREINFEDSMNSNLLVLEAMNLVFD